MATETHTSALPSDAVHEILAWLGRVEPDSLLLICPADSTLKSAVEAVAIAPNLKHLAPDDDHPARLDDEQFDFAVIADTLEHLPRRRAEQLLGRLRDLHTRRFLALVPLGADGWRNTDMIAFGLKRCARFDADERRYGLYRFNIYDYKDTPDWLNARYWANPERWGKARW